MRNLIYFTVGKNNKFLMVDDSLQYYVSELDFEFSANDVIIFSSKAEAKSWLKVYNKTTTKHNIIPNLEIYKIEMKIEKESL